MQLNILQPGTFWIDDIREPPDDSWYWIKNVFGLEHFFYYLQNKYLIITEISFDHDLGNKFGKMNGYHVAG